MGVLLMLLASACFATMAALVKAVGPEVPLPQQVFLRCALALPILVPIIYVKKAPFMVRARKLLVTRSLFGMTAMLGNFYALTHMPLADCVFLGRTEPLLLALASPLVNGERAPRAAWLAIATGLAGVALIMQPALEHWPLAAWVALGGSACAAGAQLLIRRISRTDPPLPIVFDFTLFTALITLGPALYWYRSMDSRQWALFLGIGFLANLGQFLMTCAYSRDRAPAVAAASYSSLVLSVVYGYLFWDETPQPLAWAGGLLILAGGYPLVKSRRGREEPARQVEGPTPSAAGAENMIPNTTRTSP